MDISIESKLLVISSGSVIAYDGQSNVTFKIGTLPDNQISIVLCFAKTEDGKQNLTGNGDGKTLTITCSNFDNSLGVGTNGPLLVGHLNGEDLLLSFWVYTLGDGATRRVDYTFFNGHLGENK
jgi:hypothetical protein